MTTFEFQTATPFDLELMLSKPIPADLELRELDAPVAAFTFDAIEFPFEDCVDDSAMECMRSELAVFVLQQLEADKLDAQVVAKRVLRRRKRLREEELRELDALNATNKKLRALCETHGLHWAGLEVLQYGCMLRAAREAPWTAPIESG